MHKKSFGGDWTEEKLKRLSAYLRQYRRIFTKNPKAQFFQTIYVDAFASTGYRLSNSEGAKSGLVKKNRK